MEGSMVKRIKPARFTITYELNGTEDDPNWQYIEVGEKEVFARRLARSLRERPEVGYIVIYERQHMTSEPTGDADLRLWTWDDAFFADDF